MKAEPEVEQQATAANQQLVYPSQRTPHPLFHRHAVNIALIVIALIAMFWRVFFLGETLIDVATLNNQLPWGYYAGESDYRYNRRDLTDMYVTRDYFVVSAYRDGEMPLWNPYTMAGHPIYADGVTRTLSPFLMFYKFFDVPLGYSLARITELILAAIFMYIFLIAINVSAGGALMGALVFELSAHSMLHLTGLGWWGGLMWLPLIILFTRRALTRGSFTQATIAGVLLAAQFFCGYMPNQIYYVGAVVLYYLYFAFVRKRRQRDSAITRDLALMFVTLAVGLALAATQWVPMLELLRHSNRKIVGAELSYIYLPPWYGLTLIFPNLFGAAYDTRTLTLFTALGVSHDHILYLSIAALLPLAFIIYQLKSADSRVGFFALLAAISLVIMMTTPLYVPVTRFIPVLQVIRVAVRAGVLFLFAAAALVAIGTDSLMRASNDALFRFARLARKFLFVTLGFVAAAVIASYLMALAGFAVETSDRGRAAFIRKSAAALVSQFTPPDAGIIIPLVLLSVAVISLWLLSKERLSRNVFFASLVALLIVDLFWASGQFNRSFDRSRVYPATQITDRLRQLPPGRVLVVPSDLETNRRAASQEDKIIAPPNTLLPYQISTVTGKNQQFPKWYREYAALIEPQPNLSHVVFDQTHSRFFDMLNVRYVVTHAATPLAGYDLIATAEGLSIYENKNALPRAFFASRVIEVNNHADAIETLRASAFDAADAVVIESANASAQGIDNAPEARQISPPQATIIEDRRNRVVIETENEDSGMLVLSDNYYPGWNVSVDGASAELFRANCTMRAVQVPAGRHMVSFVFIPMTFKASVYISLVTAALVAFGLIVIFFRFRNELKMEQ
ncbi:MAG TPA: YfhO family protein [Blastocatellia bacterium]|nr:YfhO family protein [Blastocatellia bacterium]